MVSQDAAWFCDHRHCGSADMMFLVVEWQDSTCPASIHHYCLSLKDMTWKHTACHNNNFDPGHTQLKQATGEKFENNFYSSSQNGDEKEKEATKSRWRLKRLRVEPPPRSQHPAKFSDHKSYESGDINFLNCHVTSYWSRDQQVMWR